MLGLGGMRLRGRLVSWLEHMGDVIVHQFVQGHNAADRPDRDVGLSEQTPNPKLPRIGMDLLEMIHLHHPWQPDFAGGLLGTPFFVYEPRKVLCLKPGDPGIDGRSGDLQKATDTALVPALIGEFHDVEPCVVAIGMGMGSPQLQLVLCGHRTLVPQDFRGLVIEGIGALAEHNLRQFPIMKATIEGFETVNLLPDIVGDRAGPHAPPDFDMGREEP